jgi:hypothetical protein
MEDKGWIKIHRKMFEHPFASDPHWVALWVWMLCRATRTERRARIGKTTKTFILQPGQFISGRKQMAEETGINESKVKRLLKLMKNDQQIDQRTSPAGSLFTVLNWQSHQKVTNEMTNAWPTDDQRVTTKQEGKKERISSSKGEPILKFDCSGTPSEWTLTREQVAEWSDAYPTVDILAECKKAKAWTDANTHKTAKGMKRFLVNWLGKAVNANRYERTPTPTRQPVPAKKAESTWELNTKLTAVKERLRTLKSKSPGEHCHLYDFLSEDERREWSELTKRQKELERKLTQ